MTANKTTEEIFKKPSDKPYKEILSFAKTGIIILLFKSKNYKVSVSIGLNSSRMYPNICVFDTFESANLVRANFLDATWLDSVRQRGMPEMRGKSNKKVTVYGTITFHLQICESRTRVTFSAGTHSNRTDV